MYNSENRPMIDSVLNLIVEHSQKSEAIIPFFGVCLYLSKKEYLLDKDIINQSLIDYISQIDSVLSKDPLYKVIVDVIRESSNSLSTEDVNFILDRFVIWQFYDSEYLYWFDYAIQNIHKYKRLMGQNYVPRSLTILAQAFICDDARNVFSPFGGLLNFATDLEKFDSFDSFELDYRTWQIGMLRLGLGGIADKCNYSCQPFNHWPSKKYDTIISMPPFNTKIDMWDSCEIIGSSKGEDAELVAPCRFLEATTADGLCLAFVSTSVLYGPGAKRKFRSWAIENIILDTIILLPGNMLVETNRPMACIILRKRPHLENSVRIVDASGIYTNHNGRNGLEIGELMMAYHQDKNNISRSVSYDEIISLDYSWNIHEYLAEEEECPEGYSSLTLESVVTLPVLQSSSHDDKGRFVGISDLSPDWTNPYIDISSLEEASTLNHCFKLSQKAILLSSVRSLKPSIIEASEECPVWIHQRIFAVIPNEGIDEQFLCMALAKMNVPTLGAGLEYLSKTYILRHKIAIPEDILVQRNLYKEAAHAVALSKANELGLQEIISQMKAEYIDEVRMRKHDMKPYMRQIRSCNEILLLSLNELPNEYKETLLLQKDAIEALSKSLDRLSEEDVFGKSEVFCLVDQLRSFVNSFSRGKNYSIEVDCEDLCANGFFENEEDKKSTAEYAGEDDGSAEWDLHVNREIAVVNMAKSDFDTLVQNILTNAEDHGFTDSNRDDYVVRIFVKVDVSRGMFQLDFCNNGNPLPNGLTKERYGLKGEKAGATGKSGIGGHRVKSIVRHYDGDYEILSEPLSSTPVIISVYLPIHYGFANV